MGEALLTGLLASGWADAGELAVVEKIAARRAELAEAHPGVTIGEDVLPAAGAVVAVKPGDVESACRAIGRAGVDRVLSIAAGVRLASLESWIGGSTPAPDRTLCSVITDAFLASILA